MTELTGVRVGLLQWQPGDELAGQIARASTRLGCHVVKFLYNEPIPRPLEVVIALGPFGSLTPLAQQLLNFAPAERPAFIFLMSEQLPNPTWPEWLRFRAGRVRSHVERWVYRPTPAGVWQPRPGLAWLGRAGHRLRYYGDLYWLQQSGILTVLAVTSHWTADFLRRRGFEPAGPFLGYDPDNLVDFRLERDIPVLWLGKAGTARRRRLLHRVEADLRQRGIELLVIDGVRHPYVFGPARDRLLGRTKIVLNLLRAPWDDNSLRFVLAALQQALVVSEPMLPHSPFKPGVHLVEAPVEQLAETIGYYLAHEAERARLAAQAHQLITSQPVDLFLEQLLTQALAANARPQPEATVANLGLNHRPGKGLTKWLT